MSSLLWTLLVTVLCLSHASTSVHAESHYTNEWVAHIKGGEQAARSIAKRHGYLVLRSVANFEDHYLLTRIDVPDRSKRNAHHHTRRLAEEENVFWVEQQIARSRVKRSVVYERRKDGRSSFNDPQYREEWYLEKEGLEREEDVVDAHPDLQIKSAWELGYSGRGIVLSILDDGIEGNHSDLASNYDPKASYDFNSDDADPSPRYDPTNENRHGTRCAGEVAMVADNGICGVGVAFNSKIGGVRMLDGKVTDRLEAGALSHAHTYIDIYSASWGPNDDGSTLEGPGKMTKDAITKGITKGRNGKGVIYVWASGNGGRLQDNCNCDGYTSSIYTLSVSSSTQYGKVPWYGELCSSSMATTYSSGNGGEKMVVSTDIRNKCTTHFSGTSAAAPMAAGIIALTLEANPTLTWRDVQHLVAFTSKMGALKNVKGWYKNGAGFCVNLAFGFGLMDAKALVLTAKNWVNVPKQKICKVGSDSASNLPQKLTSGHFVVVNISTDACHGESNEVNYLEHVIFRFTLSYSNRGAISVRVTSPSGTETMLMLTRESDQSKDGFKNWPLMSVHEWGEHPRGVWKFTVEDDNTAGTDSGMLKDVTMEMYGTTEAPHYRHHSHIKCDVDLETPHPTHLPSTQPQVSERRMYHPSSLADMVDDLLHTSQYSRDSERRFDPEEWALTDFL